MTSSLSSRWLNRCSSFRFNAVVQLLSLAFSPLILLFFYDIAAKWSRNPILSRTLYFWPRDFKKAGPNVNSKFVRTHAHVLCWHTWPLFRIPMYFQHSRWHELLIKLTSTQVVGRSTCSFTPLRRSFYPSPLLLLSILLFIIPLHSISL